MWHYRINDINVREWSLQKQDRMSTDAIEGLWDSQDLDDWQYNDDSYIHLPSQCRYSNIYFAKIFEYPYFRYLNICSIDIKISGLGIFEYLGKVDIWISALTR